TGQCLSGLKVPECGFEIKCGFGHVSSPLWGVRGLTQIFEQYRTEGVQGFITDVDLSVSATSSDYQYGQLVESGGNTCR
ncbi:hypothetical protein, partial [Neisseria iguanae]|uniref:hypothetical protein n=1 Tax=Neisseria iguanae TaxID=90242 RepID=UPI001B808545